jgi:hypothetical protein
MKQEKIKASWWAPRQDLKTFRLAKFFSLTSFVVILVSTVILTLLLAHRAQQVSLKKSEDYLKLLAANLNHQVFQQFLVPIAIEKQGRITIADPEQYQRLDTVVKNTIHGFHVEKLAIYDQVGVLSYSTSQVPLGKDSFENPISSCRAATSFWPVWTVGGGKRNVSPPTSPFGWKARRDPAWVRWWGFLRSPRISPRTWRKSPGFRSSS